MDDSFINSFNFGNSAPQPQTHFKAIDNNELLKDEEISQSLPMVTNRQLMRESYRLVIVVVNDNEWQIALKFVTPQLVYSMPRGGSVYAGVITQEQSSASSSSPVDVLLVHSHDPGSYAAASLLEDVLQIFSTALVVGVGCAFGNDPLKMNIGDVLVSAKIAPYESVRIGEKDGKQNVVNRNDVRPICQSFIVDATETKKMWNVKWTQSTPSLVDSNSSSAVSRKLSIHIGGLLSGNTLVDYAPLREELNSRVSVEHHDGKPLLPNNVKLVGGEMEGDGIARACTKYNVAYAVIKGVSDFGAMKNPEGASTDEKSREEQKKKIKILYQRVASYAAFHFLRTMLQQNKLLNLTPAPRTKPPSRTPSTSMINKVTDIPTALQNPAIQLIFSRMQIEKWHSEQEEKRNIQQSSASMDQAQLEKLKVELEQTEEKCKVLRKQLNEEKMKLEQVNGMPESLRRAKDDAENSLRGALAQQYQLRLDSPPFALEFSHGKPPSDTKYELHVAPVSISSQLSGSLVAMYMDPMTYSRMMKDSMQDKFEKKPLNERFQFELRKVGEAPAKKRRGRKNSAGDDDDDADNDDESEADSDRMQEEKPTPPTTPADPGKKKRPRTSSSAHSPARKRSSRSSSNSANIQLLDKNVSLWANPFNDESDDAKWTAVNSAVVVSCFLSEIKFQDKCGVGFKLKGNHISRYLISSKDGERFRAMIADLDKASSFGQFFQACKNAAAST